MTGESGLLCLEAREGKAKEDVLGAAIKTHEFKGCQVIGLEPTGRAAATLKEAGIFSMMLHGFLKKVPSQAHPFTPGTVLILDEASMVDVRRMDSFLREVSRLSLKTILGKDTPRKLWLFT